MSANELNLLKASAISLSDTRRFQQTVQTIGATITRTDRPLTGGDSPSHGFRPVQAGSIGRRSGM